MRMFCIVSPCFLLGWDGDALYSITMFSVRLGWGCSVQYHHVFCQVGMGMFCIATQSAGIAYDAHLAYLGTGIWTGILVSDSTILFCFVKKILQNFLCPRAMNALF